MLLRIELPGVETPRVTESGELPGREDRFQEFAGREGKQLGDVCYDCDAGLANAEELVDKRSVKWSIGKCVARVLSVLQKSTYPAATKMVPMIQARNVLAGVVGSSWLSTTARTSAYGEF